MTRKLLLLDTPFDGPVYISPEHVTAVCKPKSDSAFPRAKIFLSSGIEFEIKGDPRQVAEQIEAALSCRTAQANGPMPDSPPSPGQGR
jgi:hypothetical protein